MNKNIEIFTTFLLVFIMYVMFLLAYLGFAAFIPINNFYSILNSFTVIKMSLPALVINYFSIITLILIHHTLKIS